MSGCVSRDRETARAFNTFAAGPTAQTCHGYPAALIRHSSGGKCSIGLVLLRDIELAVLSYTTFVFFATLRPDKASLDQHALAVHVLEHSKLVFLMLVRTTTVVVVYLTAGLT